MDHWGDDPWADHNISNSNELESPTKQQVAPPVHTASNPQSFLNNVWDDAQWGTNDDENVGGWPEEVQPVGTAGLPMGKSLEWSTGLNTKHDDYEDKPPPLNVLPESYEWDMVHEEPRAFKDGDNVVSERSDSATTIQPDEAPAHVTTDPSDSQRADDDLSTRPSMSSSDLSPNGTASESARTSFEDERIRGRAGTVGEDDHNGARESGSSLEAKVELQPGVTEEVDDFCGPENQVCEREVESKPDAGNAYTSSTSPGSDSGTRRQESTESLNLPSKHASYPIDSDLMNQLFPPIKKDLTKLEEAPDDPVHSSSATRRAWYRLIRKQTMREFNSGQDYDNYIRVTWKTSTIRSEVNKTVLRWANEDRMAGRGPGARASFYWDTTAPSDQKTPFHPRQRSTAAVSNPIRPPSKEVHPLSTDVPAAFSWSSPSITNDPWKESSNYARSSSSPVALPKHIAVAKLQRQEGRGGSVDLSPRPRDPASHKRTATSTDIPKEASVIPTLPPVPQPMATSPSSDANPWAGLDALDTNSLPKQEVATGDDDDDDEWGEMVESPAVSMASTPFADSPEPSTPHRTLSTPDTTPQSVKTSPLQSHLVQSGSKHASPIVRLKGTVSPTSAVFKVNAFIPPSTEQGPIGPGLLKSRSTSAQSAQQNSSTPPPPVAQLDEVLNTNSSKPSTPKEPSVHQDDDGFSAFETSDAEPAILPSTSTTPTPAPPPSEPVITATTASWADGADFSIFESSVPQTALPPTLSTATPDPTDSWSIFDTPPPPPLSRDPGEDSSSTTPYTRPTPRTLTPPTVQPPPPATSSAQRRKWEEDELVRRIVKGLPDLGYMLRR